MHVLQVLLPTQPSPTSAILYYEHSYSQGRHFLDYLHIIRQTAVYFAIPDPDALEETYWQSLDRFRKKFAADCFAAIKSVDLLVDPPSHRGFHRPFLSAFKCRYPHVGWLMFGKTAAVTADISDMQRLRERIKRQGCKPTGTMPKVSQVHDIVIVDDVYATGATAAVVVEQLSKANSPADIRFHIAAPLRIPPKMMKDSENVILCSDVPLT